MEPWTKPFSLFKVQINSSIDFILILATKNYCDLNFKVPAVMNIHANAEDDYLKIDVSKIKDFTLLQYTELLFAKVTSSS